uniref:Alpha-S1-casein n=1 Tax=Cavia porcellus TaxID=10141 RepID=CASA1_CAVPO|nr:RecName: Full=Alpha-S1-casein; AltName: Full=Casein-B; Flags: Precursor [Cavia porcellus]CAA25452.1 casein B [Cavia cutleri]
MKLLILTCLVASAVAMPKFPFRHTELFQTQRGGSSSSSSSEERLKEENIFKFDQQKELQRKQSEKIKEIISESTEQREASSISSSEEVVPKNTEQKHIPQEDALYQQALEQLSRLIKYHQLQMEVVHAQEQFHRINEHNQAQVKEPMRVFNQLDAYPFAAWYYGPEVQYMSFLPFSSIPQPIFPEDAQNTEVMPEWVM